MGKSKQQAKSGSSQMGTGQDSSSSNLVSQVISKITSEPLLFLIAVVVLVIGFASQAAISSADMRFIVVVIAVLAALAIVGYYFVQVLLGRSKSQAQAQQPAGGSSTPSQPAIAGLIGTVDVQRVVSHGKAIGLDVGTAEAGAVGKGEARAGAVEDSGEAIGIRVKKIGGPTPPAASGPATSDDKPKSGETSTG